jgi:hypothetical protein
MEIQMNNPKCLSTSLPVNPINNSLIGRNIKTFDVRYDNKYSKYENE